MWTIDNYGTDEDRAQYECIMKRCEARRQASLTEKRQRALLAWDVIVETQHSNAEEYFALIDRALLASASLRDCISTVKLLPPPTHLSEQEALVRSAIYHALWLEDEGQEA